MRLLVSLIEQLRAEVELPDGWRLDVHYGQLAVLPLTEAGWEAYERLYPWPHAGVALLLDLARQLAT